ncbi:MAG: winged helix-turn-helix domain-containing protein [Infirmifilum sp.]|jgi:molybdate transport system regulatory protein|uniref:ModE family transcriptional regulator n=1 Tax=Infirmifilum uzonense TaxID=1550241 RepID=A0A0F7CL11_9CREN|nr:winged helix-turn-helix domain-containing protein [Infirmifilum uzonense]AKG38601.1 ModE family transcriptional regulator [Infirmifilum uzonense]
MVKIDDLEVKYKVWLAKDGKPVIGSGGASLLKAILETGSINAAANALGYSYSFAWTYLKKIEQRTGLKVVEKTRGGEEKGGATLTPEGKRLLELYLRAEEAVRKALENI